MSALVISEIFRLFVNTFTSADKYSRRNMQNFPQQFETPLCQKVKTFCGFFSLFLKCAWEVEHFEQKDDYPGLVIAEILESERGGYLNVKMVLLRNPFGNQRVNGFKTLLKSARHQY